MAVVQGVQRGAAAYPANGGAEAVAPVRLGVNDGLVLAAIAQSLALPVDASSNPYPCVRVTVNTAIWFAFTTGTGSAAVATPGSYLLTPGSYYDMVVPTGATTWSAIVDPNQAVPITVGSICVTGIY